MDPIYSREYDVVADVVGSIYIYISNAVSLASLIHNHFKLFLFFSLSFLGREEEIVISLVFVIRFHQILIFKFL